MIKSKRKHFTLLELEKSKTSRIRKNKRMFTLIELIIVIVVIGILAGMALPKFTGVVRNSKVAAMITDIDTLEKAIKMYENDNDTLPIYYVGIDGSNLDDSTKNMDDIYLSLKEVLKVSDDGEEYLYKINMDESSKYHSKTKYGHGKTEKDFYVYSTKTNKVYYYGYLINGDNTLQHNDIKTTFTLNNNSLEKKKPSIFLSSKNNNKPIVDITTNLEELETKSIIEWKYSFIDEDNKPTSYVWTLDNIEYNDTSLIPTQLEEGEHTIKFKAIDSKGVWSDETIKTFNVKSSNILEKEILISYGNGFGGFLGHVGKINKEGNLIVTDNELFNSTKNSLDIYFVYDNATDYKKLENLYLEITTDKDTKYTNLLKYNGWIYPNSRTYKIPLIDISKQSITNGPSNVKYLSIVSLTTKLNSSSTYWKVEDIKIVKE